MFTTEQHKPLASAGQCDRTTYRANFAPLGGQFEIQQASIAEIHMDTPRARSKNTAI